MPVCFDSAAATATLSTNGRVPFALSGAKSKGRIYG